MEDRVTQYAENIVSGKTLAGKPVIATAKRQLKDLEKSESDGFEYYFDVDKASRIIKFIEMLPNTTTGDAMQLAPFQAFIVGSIHGWRYKKNDHRRFNKATISLSRKQGKTLINAGIDRKSTRLNSSHVAISYAVFCLKKKKHRAIHSCWQYSAG